MKGSETMEDLPEAVGHLVERMSRQIHADPQYLLEQAGGPVGRQADWIVAQLVGHDDQIEWRRLNSVPPEVMTPIPNRNYAQLDATGPETLDGARTARWQLQSGYAVAQIAAELVPGHHGSPAPDWTYSVLLVRYRRTL